MPKSVAQTEEFVVSLAFFMKITKLNGHFFSFLGFHGVVLSKETKTNRNENLFSELFDC